VHRLILVAFLALSACGAAPTTVTGFRAVDAPIYSAAALAPARITGDWRQVASFASKAGGCAAGGLTFTPAAGGLSVSGTLCLDGKPQRIAAIAQPSGPGRFSLAGQEDWWVLWVDSGYRTLAIGTPSGRFGFVLDRGAIPPDRLAAAREVFDFNGYITPALRPF
jgi:apolipoprotein D and lipocalin family protein